MTLDFQVLSAAGDSTALRLTPDRLVIAGWTGRDEAAVAHHVAELAALGVKPPSATPLFYAAAASLLMQGPRLQVVGDATSGEAEPVLVITPDGRYIGLGSDHTDRHAEEWSVPHSKQLCGKPLAPTLWRFSDLQPHWDELVLRSWIPDADGGWTLYQEGTVAALQPPDRLVRLAGGLGNNTVMFCGTMPVVGGIRPAPAFRMELSDPVLGRRIEHRYDVVALPIVT